MPRPIEGHCRERMRERVEEAGGAAHVRLAGGAAAWRISPSVDEAAMPRRARARGSSRHPVASAASATRSSGDLRSEEHTSELQSRLHLVCRLLLEKKKKNTQTPPPD